MSIAVVVISVETSARLAWQGVSASNSLYSILSKNHFRMSSLNWGRAERRSTAPH
jgi:hypothetical protein